MENGVKKKMGLASKELAKMKIISDEDMAAIVEKLHRPDSNWRSVVAALDTVCIQSKGQHHTLLHPFAGESSTRGLTAYLLEAGVPADGKDKGGWTALYHTAMRGDLIDCKLLCDYGAEMNSTDDRRCPVAAALRYGHPEVALWLLQHPRFHRRWNATLFESVCDRATELIVPYLNLFVVEIDGDPSNTCHLPEQLRRRKKHLANDAKSVVYCFHLADIYGLPDVPVASTALAQVIKTPSACDALDCTMMRYMIKAKWLAFGKAMFRQEIALYSALLLTFSVSIISDQMETWNKFHGSQQCVTGLSRILAAVCASVLLLRVERREAYVEGIKYFASFWNLLGAGTYVGIVVVVAYQSSGEHSELLQAAIGTLNVALWVNMFQYLQMVQSVAVLITMMSHMVNDVAKFIMLYCMFLFGFSGGFYAVLYGQPGYETFVDSLITVLLVLFGQITYDPFHAATGLTWFVSNLFLLAYLVSVVIVLLNLLIAMLSTSYSRVWGEAEGQVLLCYARAIVRMEQSLTKADRENQLLRLKMDVEKPRPIKNPRSQRWWTLADVEEARSRASTLLANPSISRAKRLVAGIQYVAMNFIYTCGAMIVDSAERRRDSVSPLAMNNRSRCSTLEDGERMEVVRKMASNDEQEALTAQVDELKTLMGQQTALINELLARDSMRTNAT